jgi:hypothetical protein
MKSLPNNDRERLRRIRDKIRLVFGRKFAMDDSRLS